MISLKGVFTSKTLQPVCGRRSMRAVVQAFQHPALTAPWCSATGSGDYLCQWQVIQRSRKGVSSRVEEKKSWLQSSVGAVKMYVSFINNVWVPTWHLSYLPEVAHGDHKLGDWDFQRDLACGQAAARNLVLKFASSSLLMAAKAALLDIASWPHKTGELAAQGRRAVFVQ